MERQTEIRNNLAQELYIAIHNKRKQTSSMYKQELIILMHPETCYKLIRSGVFF